MGQDLKKRKDPLHFKMFSRQPERMVPMYKFMRIHELAKPIFGNANEAHIVGQIMSEMITAQSPRVSYIADAMPSEEAANRKKIDRFLKTKDT